MHRLTLSIVMLLSALALACNDEPEDDKGVGECSDQNPTLSLDNQTGNTIQVVHFWACDMSEQSDFPFPPPGLADGESVDIPFPGYGCWRLGYEGEGCQGDMAVTVSDIACGESFTWTPDDQSHVCVGG